MPSSPSVRWMVSDLKEELGLCQGLASMQSSAIKILENKIALLERKLELAIKQRDSFGYDEGYTIELQERFNKELEDLK